MQARFVRGTFARIAAVLEDGEDRTDFVRFAVERELAERRPRARARRTVRRLSVSSWRSMTADLPRRSPGQPPVARNDRRPSLRMSGLARNFRLGGRHGLSVADDRRRRRGVVAVWPTRGRVAGTAKADCRGAEPGSLGAVRCYRRGGSVGGATLPPRRRAKLRCRVRLDRSMACPIATWRTLFRNLPEISNSAARRHATEQKVCGRPRRPETGGSLPPQFLQPAIFSTTLFIPNFA
jgi:hypothetical protein